MDALEHWRIAAQSALNFIKPGDTMLPALGTAIQATPEPNKTSTGLFNTHLQFEEKRVSQVIMVNSLDRDPAVYPLPTQVRLKLPRIYKNVERIDIVQLKFFCGLYVISALRKNNRIAVNTLTNFATIPDGTYTLTQLLAVVQAALISAGVTGCSVSYSSTTGRITIAAPSNFSLLFKTALPVYNRDAASDWGLGWNLGFGGLPVDLSGANTYTASCFLRIIDDYIYLQLNDTEHMNEVDHTSLEKTGKAQDSTGQVAHYFGKLLLNNFGCWAQTFVEAPKTFAPVLGRLERLQFTWTDRFGNAILGPDAASCDWHMALRITEIAEVPAPESSLTMSIDRLA